jgi:hypothetical protein
VEVTLTGIGTSSVLMMEGDAAVAMYDKPIQHRNKVGRTAYSFIMCRLSPGNSILLLALVEIQGDLSTPLLRKHSKHQSDDLIEDLENHLGTCMKDYLKVRISYASMMPSDGSENYAENGLSEISYRTELLATACIKKHNSSSIWSPQPAPAPNPLFHIVASH